MNKLKTNIAYLLLVTAICTTILIILSCDETPNGPEENFGRRDYEWVVDTIDPGPGYLTYGFNLWGAEPDDVWFIGGADTRLHPIWHWDGNKWKNIVLDEFITGAGIWGTSSNSVWMGTTNSSIWNYDGASWRKKQTLQLEGYDRIVIQSLHGVSEDEIYGAGFADRFDGMGSTRVLIKFNGDKWIFLPIPKLEETFTSVIVDEITKDIILTSSRRTIPGDISHIYSYRADSLYELYSGDRSVSLGSFANNSYIVIGQTIYKYKDHDIISFKDFSGSNYSGRIWGRSEMDFFTANEEWTLGHYNGKDIIELYELKSLVIQMVVFPKEVIVLSKDINSPKDFIIKGRLK